MSAAEYRDRSGRTLQDYPRPSVAVDTAVLTVAVSPRARDQQPSLRVVLVPRDTPAGPTHALPGTFLHPGETLQEAALRALRDKAGIDGLAPRQLHVFDDPNRDDRGWVLSVGHVDVVPIDRLTAVLEARAGVELAAVDSLGRGRRRLAYDHRDIVRLAAAEVRAAYEEHPDPYRLLAEPFTMRQLRLLHDAVRGHVAEASRDTFRRRMEPQLEPTGELSSGTVGKPAALYRNPARRTSRSGG